MSVLENCHVGDHLVLVGHSMQLTPSTKHDADLPEFVHLTVKNVGSRTIRCGRIGAPGLSDISLLRDPKGHHLMQSTHGARELPSGVSYTAVIRGNDPIIQETESERMRRARIREAENQARDYERRRRDRMMRILGEVVLPITDAPLSEPVDLVSLRQSLHDALETLIATDVTVYRYHLGDVGPITFTTDGDQTPREAVEAILDQRDGVTQQTWSPEGLTIISGCGQPETEPVV